MSTSFSHIFQPTEKIINFELINSGTDLATIAAVEVIRDLLNRVLTGGFEPDVAFLKRRGCNL